MLNLFRKLWRPSRSRLGAASPVATPGRAFPGSETYWLKRYASGGNSGPGSYNELAAFKAEVINEFVHRNAVRTVIEHGCGDGNQLALAKYPDYIGFDISPVAVGLCVERFRHDPTKRFFLSSDYSGERAELALSLDVVYHLVEEDVYQAYMRRLFDSASRFVIVYASNMSSSNERQAPHVRHREFTTWVSREMQAWRLVNNVPNRHPYSGDAKTGSFAEFFFFEVSR